MRHNQLKRASQNTQLNQNQNSNQTKSKFPIANLVLGVVTASLLGLVATISGVLIASGSTTQADQVLEAVATSQEASSILTRVSESSAKKHDKPTKAEFVTTTVIVNQPVAEESEMSIPVTSTSSEEQSSDYVTYTVQAGDSFDRISTKFFGDGSGIKSILQQNQLTESSVLHPGQVLNFQLSYVVQEEPETEVEVTPPTTSEVPEASAPVEASQAEEPQAEPSQPTEMTWESLGLSGYKVVAGGLDEQTRIAIIMELQNRTGASYKEWAYIISRESGWLPTIKNSIGYYGLFQLAPGYLGYDADVQSQIEGAIYLYNNGGFNHWAL
jgi:hypothetical protein